jgi:hypothetical protein
MSAHAARRPRKLLTDYESRHEPLLPTREFAWRVFGSAILALGSLSVCLGLGVLGYHRFARLGWLDSLVNASMILGGMGPVDPVRTTAGKWFESAYAIFSGVAFLTSVGVLLAPIAHRFLHRFHLEEGS